MVLIIRTKSGSVYTISTNAHTWERVAGENAAKIRTTEGKYELLRLRLGSPMIIEGPPLEEGAARFITTTPVVDIAGIDES